MAGLDGGGACVESYVDFTLVDCDGMLIVKCWGVDGEDKGVEGDKGADGTDNGAVTGSSDTDEGVDDNDVVDAVSDIEGVSDVDVNDGEGVDEHLMTEDDAKLE